VFSHGKGIVVNEPSIVAINKVSGRSDRRGREAKEMRGGRRGTCGHQADEDGVMRIQNHRKKS